jgi:Holliday junction resolvase RusA-like endonuclease
LTVALVPRHPARVLVLDLTIQGNPLPKARARITRRGNFTPARTLHNEMSIEWEMKAKVANPVRGQVIVDVDFFRGDKRACDLDNLLKQIFDCANGIVWHDDSQVVALYAQKLFDKTKPRTELRVWKVVEPE